MDIYCTATVHAELGNKSMLHSVSRWTDFVMCVDSLQQNNSVDR
jgi:hypothetical protein